MSKRIWFCTLSSVERSLVNLTIRVVDEVKSSRLHKILGEIVQRLEYALENRLLRKAWDAGSALAERRARIAYGWGYVKALSWAKDRMFILFLGVTHMNSPKMFGCL